MPDIRQGGRADSVLLKHAKDTNMPPAQLEKLAHVVNTMRTVNFIDKAADAKGSTFDLVDVPGLMSAYQTYEPPTPSKTATAFTPEPNYDVPDIMGELLPKPIQKAAHQADEDLPAYPMSRVSVRRQLYADQWSKEAREQQTKLVESIGDEALDKARETMTKVATYIRNSRRPETFAEIEHDMAVLLKEPAQLKQAFDDLVRFCRNQPVKRASEVADSRLVVTDRHDMLPSFRTILEQLQIRKNASGYTISDPTPWLDPNGNFTGPPPGQSSQPRSNKGSGQQQTPRPSSGGSRGNQGSGSSTQQSAQSGGSRSNQGSDASPSAQSGVSRSNDPGSESDTAQLQELLNLVQRNANPQDGKVDGKPPEKKSPLGLLSGNLEQWQTDLLQSIGGQGGTNTRQKARDAAAAEVREVTNFERLLATDPVLSQANPAQLTSFYNSLRRQSPTVAGDINQLRMVLRQAAQYQGLTPDVVKTLVETEGNLNKSRALGDTSARARYEQSAQKVPGPKGLFGLPVSGKPAPKS